MEATKADQQSSTAAGATALFQPEAALVLDALDTAVRVEIGGVIIEPGDVIIEPGDVIVADLDGICVVPAAIETEIFAHAAKKASREDKSRAAVRAGASLAAAHERFGVL